MWNVYAKFDADLELDDIVAMSVVPYAGWGQGCIKQCDQEVINIFDVILFEHSYLLFLIYWTVACSRGTRSNDDVCVKCPYGFYQDEPQQTSCKPCPDGYTTPGAGSKSRQECSGQHEQFYTI